MYEGNTLALAIEKLKDKYGITGAVIVADSGLLSEKNIKLIKTSGYQYTRTSYVVQVFWELV